MNLVAICPTINPVGLSHNCHMYLLFLVHKINSFGSMSCNVTGLFRLLWGYLYLWMRQRFPWLCFGSLKNVSVMPLWCWFVLIKAAWFEWRAFYCEFTETRYWPSWTARWAPASSWATVHFCWWQRLFSFTRMWVFVWLKVGVITVWGWSLVVAVAWFTLWFSVWYC